METCIFALLFVRAIMNIFIQVIFPNIISFSARTFLRGTKSYKFPNEINLLNWCKYLFYLPSQLCTNDSQNAERMN